MKRIIIGTFCILLIFSLISFSKSHPGIYVNYQVVNSEGKGIENAIVQSTHSKFTTDSRGNAKVELKSEGPDTILVSAKGFLSEVAPVGWADNNKTIKIKLLDDKKNRVVINFGGDVMFGRRYVEPNNATPQEVDNTLKIGSNSINQYISTAFSNADLSCVNFESTIGNLDMSEKQEGKRFLLQSPTESVSELKGMGVDLVCLANNHIRDWGDKGVHNTIDALKSSGFQTVGAGTEVTAREPAITMKEGVKIGTLAYTSVNGAYVNTFFPKNLETKPQNVSKKNEWLWEKRSWEYHSKEWSFPEGEYRIGEVWNVFSEIEDTLSEEVQSQIWRAIEETYPELQNWVAKYGESGAADWKLKKSKIEISELKKKVDLVIVQLHCGFQFKTSPSNLLIEEAHNAIDAGADIVVAHHPHVLQGMEWYKGHLIVYSLGNLAFDQEFLNTFASGFLRTVWDGNNLVEARFVPSEIVNYVPIPVTGISATKIFNTMWESSVLQAYTKRYNNYVYTVETTRNKNSKPVQFCYEWGTARVTDKEVEEKQTIILNKNEIKELDADKLWPARLGLNQKSSNNIFIGRDLFGWGHMEDTLADAQQMGGTHFDLKQHGEWVTDRKHKNQTGFIKITNNSENKSVAMIRTEARIPLTDHRIYNGSYAPLDPEATYSIRMKVKGTGDVKAKLRIDSYWFYDRNPIEDPCSELLGQNEYNLNILDDEWQTIEIPVSIFKSGEKETNSIMAYIELEPPIKNKSMLYLDDFLVLEWRDAGLMPDIYGAYTHIKNKGDKINLEFDVLKSN